MHKNYLCIYINIHKITFNSLEPLLLWRMLLKLQIGQN